MEPQSPSNMMLGHHHQHQGKKIQIILRLFLVIPMYCQTSSSQMQSITQPPTLLAG